VSFAVSIEHHESSLEEALFGPFFSQQRQYRRLQMLELQAAVPTFTQNTGASGTIDQLESEVGVVRGFVPKMVIQMRLAVVHCIELTAGAAASELVFTLNEYAAMPTLSLAILIATSRLVHPARRCANDIRVLQLHHAHHN
jgi:hypothetical protein